MSDKPSQSFASKIAPRMGLPTEIGKEEVAVKDSYEGVSDEELIEKIEELTAKYKERLNQS